MSPQKGETNADFIKRVAEELGEHFDVVQIFVQTDSPEKTVPFQAGYGNMYARVGQIERWLEVFDRINEVIEFEEDDE